jgi:ferredoxin/coenzyme F420-reducing hydrogenase delta subunit
VKALAPVLAWFESRLSFLFRPESNPFHHLGALCIYCFWIALVSGIYLFVFYETSIEGSWASVERMTHGQWWAGGVMRSLHRYASDAAVLFLLGHILREFVRGRFTGARWFSWFTGVPLVWIVIWLGISGYWMVWDQLAQYVAVSTARLFDVLPVFTDPMSRNFLDNGSLSDRFFTLIAFIHLIGLPIFLVLGIWFHLLRIRLPRINPPRALMASSLAAMLALSLLHPALSHAQADLGIVPTALALDWWYLGLYPLQYAIGEGWTWLLLASLTLLLAALPWLWPARRPAAAVVHLPDCTGCGYCVEDCPYGAIDLVARSDGRGFEFEAKVDAAMCVGCGICTGSCPSSSPFRRQEPLRSGIELPDPSMDWIKQAIGRPAPAPAQPSVLLVACEHGAEPARAADAATTVMRLPCASMLPPAAIDYALRSAGYDGVLVAGCASGDCMHRYGDRWTEARVARSRPPMLRERVPRERLRLSWNKSGEHRALAADLARLRDGLPGAATAEGAQEAPP